MPNCLAYYSSLLLIIRFPNYTLQKIYIFLFFSQLPEQYNHENQAPQKKHKNKKKKNKYKSSEVVMQESSSDLGSLDSHEKKHKKQKRHDEDKERKKRKKEKKKKKQKHSPEHSMGSLTPNQHSNG